MAKNNPTIPTNIIPCFIVSIYKDMENADEIEFSNTFKTYKTALKYFNEERKTAKGNYFIDLKYCLEVEYKKEGKTSFTRTEEQTFVDNYSDKKE